MRAHQLLAVDEEGGRAAHARRAAFGGIRLHGGAEAALVDASGEGAALEADLDGVLHELLARKARLVGEEPVVIRPELPERARAARRLGGGPGAVMRAEREILEDEPDLAGIFLEDVVQRPLDPLAVRSLVI